MITPNILYYARLEFDATSKKTPKYVVTAQAGYYPGTVKYQCTLWKS
ncbi:hypothetical protein ABHZ63_10360 [Phocaeicola vulgatus]